MNPIIVYTGPSIQIDEARIHCADACFHEPVQCGDIIKAVRSGAKAVAIIDGYFEQRAAVWHKEILYALSQGIPVYGASSMGALRASELDQYGMVGIGQIYEAYTSGKILDDDEVALVHSDDQFDTVVTPMVNVRVTLAKAVFENRLTEQEADSIAQNLKAQPYYNRSLFNATKDTDLNQWFKTHYVDQKKLDAIALLKHLNTQTFLPPQTVFVSSLFFNKIYREMMCEPFTSNYPWLSSDEKALYALSQSPYFSFYQRIAKLLHLNYDRPDFTGSPLDLIPFVKKQAKRTTIDQLELKHYLLVEAGYGEKESETTPELSHLCTALSICLSALIQYMQSQDFEISVRFIQRYADDFRREHELLTPESTLDWLTENSLQTQERFETFIMHLAPLHHLVDNHNSHSIGLETSMNNHNWLATATQWLNESKAFNTSDKVVPIESF